MCKNLARLTNFYISFIIILTIYNIYWVVVKLIDILNFELTIDYYLCISLWVYLFLSLNNLISYIFAIVYNNFEKKWFYVVSILIIIALVGFSFSVRNLSDKRLVAKIVRDHYLITNTENNDVTWKNFSYKMYCTKDLPNLMFGRPSIPEYCATKIADFLTNIYEIFYYYINIMIIFNSPLLIIISLNLLLHYKLISAYKFTRV